jgi:cytochrome P450
VLEVHRHPGAISDARTGEAFRAGADGPWYEVWRRMMLFLDPVGHDRARHLVNRMFTPRAVERLRPVSQDVVDRLLGRLGDRREMEVIADFAYELPIAVISGLCALPEADVPHLLSLAHDFAARSDVSDLSEETIRRGDEAALALGRYFHDALEHRRRHPGDDLLSAVADIDETADGLSEDDLIANAVLLFLAGHETTANLIGNGLAALLQRPDQLETLRASPELMKDAVEEFLRFDPTIHANFRVFNEETTVAGTRIPANERVMLLVAAANHDPDRYANPDELDITRDATGHLSFGFGTYYCLGAALARVQLQLAFGGLLSRFPRLRLVEDPTWDPTLFGRGPVELRVAW